MKRFAIVAVVMALGAGIAFASSLGVPWFVDNAGVATGFPPSDGRTATLVYLHNNLGVDAVCQIQYYSAQGVLLGPANDNTFVVNKNASTAFRPVAVDPATTPGGQESTVGVLVPDRPRDVDTQKNGSCVIRWFGDPTDVQGMVLTGSVDVGYAHLLPPGR